MAVCFEPLGGGLVLAVDETHRFGTDAVLLTHFAAPNAAGERICDLGTGCGCIPFLLLQKAPAPRLLLGVDIQEAAIALCRLSAEKNGREVVRFLQADWKMPQTIAPADSFDRVICNPPYFSPDSGKKNADAALRIARHETPDTLPSLCAAAKHLLRFGGHFCLCHRPERLADCFSALQKNKLQPKRLQLVQQRVGAAPWLVLIDAVKGGKSGLSIPAPYILEDENGYSAQYMEIYGKYRNT